MIISIIFLSHVLAQRIYKYDGENYIKTPEITIIMYGSPDKYEYYDYMTNGEMEDYLTLLCTQLEWLKEYGITGPSIFKSKEIMNVNIDNKDIRFDFTGAQKLLSSGNITNTQNSVYLFFFPKGKINLITSNGIICSDKHCNPFAFITDPSMGITIIPGKRNLFILSVAFASAIILGVLSWPLISCSASYKCWKNGIKCGINLTGRTIMHIGSIALIIIFGVTGGFYIAIGLQDYRDELYWTGIGLEIAAGCILVLWYIAYIVTIGLKNTTKEEWCFSIKKEKTTIVNIIYGSCVVLSLGLCGIMFWQSLLPAVYLSTSHETIEMITRNWMYKGKQICDVCLLEWRDMGYKYMQKCWSNQYQMCH